MTKHSAHENTRKLLFGFDKTFSVILKYKNNTLVSQYSNWTLITT